MLQQSINFQVIFLNKLGRDLTVGFAVLYLEQFVIKGKNWWSGNYSMGLSVVTLNLITIHSETLLLLHAEIMQLELIRSKF